MLNPNSYAITTGKNQWGIQTGPYLQGLLSCLEPSLKTFCLKPWNLMHPLLETWNLKPLLETSEPSGSFTWNLLRTIKPEPLLVTLTWNNGTFTWNSLPGTYPLNLGTSWKLYLELAWNPGTFRTFTWNPWNLHLKPCAWHLGTSWIPGSFAWNPSFKPGNCLEPLLGTPGTFT